MNSVVEQFYSTFFTQVGLSPVRSDMGKCGCGFKFAPDPAIGKGYLWTYPVNAFCSVTVYHLSFYKDIHYCYHHSEMLTISSSSPSIAEAITGIEWEKGERLLGYFLPNEAHEYTILQNKPLESISVSFLPEFYNNRISHFYERDFSCLPEIASLLDGTIEIPSVSLALHQMELYTPTVGTSELYYEAKILELISGLIEWHTLKSEISNAKSLASSDVESVHRLGHFLQQHYCDNIDVQRLAKMCYMSKSKLSQLFRAVYGASIIEFVQALRLEQAKKLLVNSSYRICEISGMIGYKQQSSFSGMFKEKTGLTPNEFRKSGPKKD